jgi:hypothetical protein
MPVFERSYKGLGYLLFLLTQCLFLSRTNVGEWPMENVVRFSRNCYTFEAYVPVFWLHLCQLVLAVPGTQVLQRGTSYPRFWLHGAWTPRTSHRWCWKHREVQTSAAVRYGDRMPPVGCCQNLPEPSEIQQLFVWTVLCACLEEGTGCAAVALYVSLAGNPDVCSGLFCVFCMLFV